MSPTILLKRAYQLLLNIVKMVQVESKVRSGHALTQNVRLSLNGNLVLENSNAWKNGDTWYYYAASGNLT